MTTHETTEATKMNGKAKKAVRGQLLASSPTLQGIKSCIAKFYGGEKELRASKPAWHGCKCIVGCECDVSHDPKDGPLEWAVHNADGTMLSTLVRLHKGRYRFEAKANALPK